MTPPTTRRPDAAEPDDAAEDAAAAGDDSHGFPDGGGGGGPAPEEPGGEGGELEPWIGPPAVCEDAPDNGAALVVTPDPVVLPSGQLTSTLALTNCADEAAHWTAATAAGIVLDAEGGSVAPAATTELGFTIDADAHEPGAVVFDIEVDEPGHTHEVTVHAFREPVAGDLVGDFGLTAGEGAGGCANRCIVDGRISTGLASPDVTMELDLDTAALITVWLSEDEPADVDGHPGFPGQAPHVKSPIAQTWWITDLGPLEPATRYHVVLAATDELDRTEYRTGSFTTITPVDVDGGLASPDGPAGCAAQCITTALVDPTHDAAGLHVETHTSSILDVWVSTEAPDTSGDEPTFGADVDKAATTDGLDVTSWDTALPDLLADRTYHVVVRATDLMGGRSFRVGTFHTEHGPQYLVRFRAFSILGDGDDSKLWNPGELSFAWGVDGVVLGTRGEEKISLNNIVALPDDLTRTAFSFVDEGGLMPVLMANAFERDPDGLNKFCSLGGGLQSDPGRDEGCDLKWNVAGSGLTTTATLADAPRCGEFGFDDIADVPCLVLDSPDKGDDWPRFEVIVSFERL